ncbi:MAG: transketolase [Spirochaetota bacterium]|nr:transketolase [Spirochaetota bacterium]
MKIDSQKTKLAGDYIRYLALECIERSQSGHPGLPLGCADIGALLYRYILRIHPADGRWLARDRFVLSAGHGSMLLYSLLHLAGFPLSLEDLAAFRQYKSRAAGHPEHDPALGIETTTGPLGQGFANAVGIALEGKMLAARFNREGFPLFQYRVFTLMGDGCTMEGVAYEAASLAGHLGLDNLVAIYDANNITIDGRASIALSEDIAKRYEAMGWQTAVASDVGNLQAVCDSLEGLSRCPSGTGAGKPKLLILKTTIGEGLRSLRDTSKIHGSPAGLDEIVYFLQNSAMRPLVEAAYGKEIAADAARLKEAEAQAIRDKKPPLACAEAVSFMREAAEQNSAAYAAWQKLLDSYKTAHPDLYAELMRISRFEVPQSLHDSLLGYREQKPDATRAISARVLALASGALPQIVGGSADLVGSTKATVAGSSYITRDDFIGRNIAFGIREHGMGAIANGLALSGTFVPFTSTFFTFMDYMKPAVRLAALMRLKHLFIFTHDSIYVGEDGPTHQPIEHLNSLRLIPDLVTFRPANDFETAFAYLYFLEGNGPVVILGSRQNMPACAYEVAGDRRELYANYTKGGYVLWQNSDTPEYVLAGTGSEAGLAAEAARILAQKNMRVRAVSVSAPELLAKNPEYESTLFCANSAKLAWIEAASHRGMSLLYFRKCLLIDIQEFGLSAPAEEVAEHFGFTAEAVAKRVLASV